MEKVQTVYEGNVDLFSLMLMSYLQHIRGCFLLSHSPCTPPVPDAAPAPCYVLHCLIFLHNNSCVVISYIILMLCRTRRRHFSSEDFAICILGTWSVRKWASEPCSYVQCEVNFKKQKDYWILSGRKRDLSRWGVQPTEKNGNEICSPRRWWGVNW